VIKFEKRRAKAWPRSDHGFEHEKRKIHKHIRCMQEHMKKLKRYHQVFMGPAAGEIINLHNAQDFSWLQWLNPQDGK